MRALLRFSRRDETPPICYDRCYHAVKITLGAEKNPKLCEPCSAFRRAYDECAKCHADNPDGEYIVETFFRDSTTDLLDFKSFIDYCELRVFTTSGVFTEVDEVKTIQYVVPLASATGTCRATTSSSTSSVSLSLTSTMLPTATSATSAAPEPDTNSRKAWIAGPVIGGFAGLLLLAGVAYQFRLKRAKRASLEDADGLREKPQLHPDCTPRSPPREAEDTAIYEMEGSTPQPAEMAVNEVPAREMPSEAME